MTCLPMSPVGYNVPTLDSGYRSDSILNIPEEPPPTTNPCKLLSLLKLFISLHGRNEEYFCI